MNDIIYLEPDEEITKVIDRLKLSRSDSVIFVIPRGSTIAQSIVNLKILKRNAAELDKKISLITNDRITRNIASQLSLTVFSSVKEAERAKPVEEPKIVPSDLVHRRINIAGEVPAQENEQEENQGPFRVNTYSRYRAAQEVSEAEETKETEPGVEVEEADQQIEVEPTVQLDLADEAEGAEEEKAMASREPDKENVVVKVRKDSERETPKEINNLEAKNMTPIGGTFRTRSARRSRKPLVVAVLGAIVVAAALAYVFLPTAKASLVLKTEDYKSSFDVTVDRNAKEAEVTGIILPANMMEMDKEMQKEFPTTGKKDAGVKAGGKITVLNSYDTNPHKYPAGTRFVSGGKIYLTNEAFTVKAATISLVGGNPVITPGEVEVTVTAEKSGDSYNASGATYSIDGAPAKITGKGGEITGGVTKEIGIVVDSDLTSAETALKQEVLDQAKKELSDKATADGTKLVDSSVSSEIISVSSSKNVNDEADTFTYTAKIKVFGLSFKEDALRTLSTQVVEAKIGSEKMVVNPDRSTVNFTVGEYNQNQGKIILKTEFNGKIGQKIDSLAVSDSLRSKSKNRANEILKNMQGVESAEITIMPSFLKLMPFLTKSIKVEFDYSE